MTRPGWPGHLFRFRRRPVLEGNVDRTWDVVRQHKHMEPCTVAVLEWIHPRREWRLRSRVPGVRGGQQIWFEPDGPDSVPPLDPPHWLKRAAVEGVAAWALDALHAHPDLRRSA